MKEHAPLIMFIVSLVGVALVSGSIGYLWGFWNAERAVDRAIAEEELEPAQKKKDVSPYSEH